MNTLSFDMTRQKENRAPQIAWYFYYALPMLLFLAFLFSNTRLSPLKELMLTGRWIVLFGIFALTILILVFRPSGAYPLSKMAVVLVFAYAWIGITVLSAANVQISLARWGVFFVFLLFCLVYCMGLPTARDVELALRPLMGLFLLLIWLTPLGIASVRQPLRDSLGLLNGFFMYAPQLGEFMTFFGVPTLMFLLSKTSPAPIRVLLWLTLALAVLFVFFSGSRAGMATVAVFLLIAFWRWHIRYAYAGLLKFALAVGLAVAVLSVPTLQERIVEFVLKYPGQTDVFASRTSFWEDTILSFEQRELFGTGFGVQEHQAEAELGVAITGIYREQGSTILGLLEEVGVIGITPIFVVMVILFIQSVVTLVRTNDSLNLLLAQVIFAGCVWATIENYLLYLGNAASLLVFLAIFMRFRLDAIKVQAQRAVLEMPPSHLEPSQEVS